jgi:hypothetical protein
MPNPSVRENRIERHFNRGWTRINADGRLASLHPRANDLFHIRVYPHYKRSESLLGSEESKNHG